MLDTCGNTCYDQKILRNQQLVGNVYTACLLVWQLVIHKNKIFSFVPVSKWARWQVSLVQKLALENLATWLQFDADDIEKLGATFFCMLLPIPKCRSFPKRTRRAEINRCTIETKWVADSCRVWVALQAAQEILDCAK